MESRWSGLEARCHKLSKEEIVKVIGKTRAAKWYLTDSETKIN